MYLVYAGKVGGNRRLFCVGVGYYNRTEAQTARAKVFVSHVKTLFTGLATYIFLSFTIVS